MALRNDVVDAKPMDFDFGEGCGETWELIYPSRVAALSIVLDYLSDNQELDDSEWSHDAKFGWLWACEGDACQWHPVGSDCPLDEHSESWNSIEDQIRDQFVDVTLERPEDFEPAMNYAYPAPTSVSAETMQSILIGSNLCVVEIEGGIFLALQGGGMDMSWEICAAYVALGARPPAHFCELPRMAGRGKSDSDQALIEICAESLEMVAAWHTRSAERVREMLNVAHRGES